ncbi:MULTISPECIES: ActS/PrrB/RegB family redox-sensitive histidine kinase [unclassified Beijerinckia]|uniref:ActS/PrrB/RegB family redox-sensitive histidine kinase n=1 Tax=unclassified Beijerinckia TaxID=2638183 RepID=UPI00089B298D|nr:MULTISPECIES: ActS/PrrB/RegB family redox-sensitive histidine kinase [unclassified Beijerinckia]MDH7797954.1 two-component system sensor histidine kinase RegB [Beijerinckia sp. GAS462]SED04002.1 two-component system, sensor histidine kinase RegB [Beijerinckia sp. 28-YEA-48]
MTQTLVQESTGRIRVDTLIRLRWLAIAGQTAALLITAFGLNFPLPIALCVTAVAASVWLNIGLRLRYPVTHRLAEREATLLLAFDMLQLTALLYLTGGLENPFSILFLAPVMISAVSLSVTRTVALVLLMVACATFLGFFQRPLPWYPGPVLQLPYLYKIGVWIALVLGAGFITFYAFRVAEEARRLSDALTATELILAREQHLTQLDGLAAAAAHELGTPLATITLVVKELRRQLPAEGPVGEDMELLTSELQRCRTILGKLTSLGNEPAQHWDVLSLPQLLEETLEPSRDFGVELKSEIDGAGTPPTCRRNPGLLYGLGNLVENAVDFAKSEVLIKANWTEDQVGITIEDDGPGFSADVLTKLGDPYITSRGHDDRRAKSEPGSGLGLGLFIAKTLLERTGATISMGNGVAPASGARVSIRWAREEFERGTMSNNAIIAD